MPDGWAYYDDPETVPEEKLRSEACVTIKENIELPEDSNVRIVEIKSGLYATTRHFGSYKDI